MCPEKPQHVRESQATSPVSPQSGESSRQLRRESGNLLGQGLRAPGAAETGLLGRGAARRFVRAS